MHKPKVSVIMLVYNREKYLAEAIESILKQTFTDFELLIIDDGSTDKSIEIIETYNDYRIRFLKNTENMGLVYTRNRALEEASGEYLSILDSDDIAYPSLLDKQVKFLDKNRSFVMIGCWYRCIDKDNNFMFNLKRGGNYYFFPIYLLFRNYLPQSGLMIRKSMLGQERYRAEYPVSEDYDLWVRLISKNHALNLPEILVSYRIHNNTTHQNIELMIERFKNIWREQIIHKLNIIPNEDELNIHYLLTEDNFIEDTNEILAIEKWLLKLKFANDKTQYYKPEYFNKIIGEYFLKTYNLSCINRLTVLRLFWTSPLKRHICFCAKLQFYSSSLYLVILQSNAYRKINFLKIKSAQYIKKIPFMKETLIKFWEFRQKIFTYFK